MATTGFFVLWLIAVLAAVVFAVGTHYWHAFLMPFPDKLVDGYRWRDHALNNMLVSQYSWWGHYDENGWWEFYSLRNFAAHALPPVACVIFGGAYLWPGRAEHVAGVCRAFGKAGIVPLFCS